MTPRILASLFSLLLALLGSAPPASAQTPPARTNAFDGPWFVTVDCADTQDRNGLVKGYEFAFPVAIADGRLDGWHGTEGQSSSLHLTGEVRDGGALEVRAQGISGSAEFTVGRAARGTPYSYTMTGRLDGERGSAVRREVRPCTATFGRQPGPH